MNPALPTLPVEDGKKLYTLLYRLRQHPAPLAKQFFHKGEFPQVIQRGKSHCEKMSFIFIRVQPFLSDLSADEDRMSGGDQS